MRVEEHRGRIRKTDPRIEAGTRSLDPVRRMVAHHHLDAWSQRPMDLYVPEVQDKLMFYIVPTARAQRTLAIAAARQRTRGPLLGQVAGHKNTWREMVGVARSV